MTKLPKRKKVKREKLNAFMLIEYTERGHILHGEIHFSKKDAANSQADWINTWDVETEVVPVEIVYSPKRK